MDSNYSAYTVIELAKATTNLTICNVIQTSTEHEQINTYIFNFEIKNVSCSRTKSLHVECL